MVRVAKKRKVAVAISGGVDSSVVAALLKKQGYQVIGIFMHFWNEKSGMENKYHESGNKCCSLSAEEKARQVARILKIPFYVFHFEEEFKKHVVDYFIKEYDQGFTPNPCIACNKNIKFDFLFNRIKALGYDYLATGHYIKNRKIGGSYGLYKAKDLQKDQSYFLYNIAKEQLKHLKFPLGGYLKSEVRSLAANFKLPTAQRQDSQGICFILEKDISEFLKRYLKKYKKGKVVNTRGEIIGEHQGLQFYTIGQRRGIKIASAKPYYVVDLDYKKNILVVTDNEKDSMIYIKKLNFSETNWLKELKYFSYEVSAAIRYRHKPAKALISKISNGNYQLEFDVPQRAVMPGQSVVFYKKNRLIGGGVIKKNIKK